MKTAVIITGQARTFKECWKTQDWCLFRKLPDPTFFVSVADDKDADDLKVIGEKYPLHFEKVQQPEIDEPPAILKLDEHSGWGRSASVQNILRQFWALQQGYSFYRKAVNEGFSIPNILVRCRPDLWMQDIKVPFPLPGECFTPWWGTYGGVNDRLAIMATNCGDHYFDVFPHRKQLWDAGCPLHPETMLRAHLELHNVKLRHLAAEFKICRQPDAEHSIPWLVPELYHPHEIAALCLNRA